MGSHTYCAVQNPTQCGNVFGLIIGFVQQCFFLQRVFLCVVYARLT
eukprot:NODE_2487_length_423_cov_47.652406_g2406_i0.p2 GENE.NODE_2487_length_423_cov_47.652406_g2406_i0~~NODE_2487_length_423_cov_47.652406_g2406_i0.p2  ORF type:complete len:54 (+),score=19.92 NODE_2487_length_423_cov_47.652406_g2406_i0:25-162(+)